VTHNPESQQSPDSLNCETFEDRIHQILDDRLTLTGDALLMEHAAQCELCEDKLLDYDSVGDSIKLLKEDIDLILGKVDQPLRKPLTDRPIALIASLAAAFLICVATFQGLAPDQSSQNARRMVAPTLSNAHPSIPSANSSLSAINPRITPDAKTPAKRRATPNTSPFSKNFSVASTIPRIPTVSNWQDVSRQLESFEPVLNYSAEIPGVRAMQTSINMTIEMLRQSLSNSETDLDPDLGFSIDPDWLATV